MSKGGGAGKVYFVLYLAVVLELLIIIVERDEAEESLYMKQRETMKIVESILSQLQSGAGTEGINTRPQDEITIPPPGIDIKAVMGADIKSFRKYIVEVGVTDVSSALKKREGESSKEYNQRLNKLVQLANVEQIQYQVFFNGSTDPNFAPPFPTEEYLKKNNVDFMKFEPGQSIQDQSQPNSSAWEMLGLRELNLDEVKTFNNLNLNDLTADKIIPMYPNELKKGKGPGFAPSGLQEDSVFFYSDYESKKNFRSSTGELQRRAFVVNFQPPNRPGWYKLRFYSKTNRILGVRSDAKLEELSDDATVNIGTVQLTVKDLRKVYKELTATLEKFQPPTAEELFRTKDIQKFEAQLDAAKQRAMKDDNAAALVSKINLYGYIVKLLTPGQSSNFDQNRGSIEFNVRVITPKPQLADPVISNLNYTASFDKANPTFEFTISPYQGEGSNTVEGRVLDQKGTVVARVDCRPLDQLGAGVSAPARGGRREYRGVVSSLLSPGKYKLEITHKLGGKPKVESTDLEIFPTKLDDASAKELELRMQSYTYYGYAVNFGSVVASSGGKIKPDQFRVYISTDKDNQTAPINSLTVSPDYASQHLKLKPSAKEVTVRVAWVQPYTGKEFDLLPAKTYKIKQEEPNISTRSMMTETSGSATKIKVSVSGIAIAKPGTGEDGKDAKISVEMNGEPKVVDGLNGYQFSVEPSIDGDGANYSIYLELSGKPERGQSKVRGTIQIPIKASATNPLNGAKSDATKQTLTVQVNFEPDKGGPRKRTR